RREPASQGDCLLVAAGQMDDESVRAIGFHIQGAEIVEGKLALGAKAKPVAWKNPAVAGHGHVRGDRHFEYHAVSAAVFGHVGNTESDSLRWRTDGDPLAIEEYFAGVGRRDAEQNAGEFGAPRADQSGDADSLAGTNIERNILHAAGRAADILKRKNNVTRRAFGGRVEVRNFAADHELNEFGFRNCSSRREEALFNLGFRISNFGFLSQRFVTSAPANDARPHTLTVA